MSAPASICLLRTSALGDVTHVLPLIHRLQLAWPTARLSWIIGKLERKLVEGIVGVELISFDKSAGRAGFQAVHEALRGRRFDALLQMQVALRANLLSLTVRAERRIGYDRARGKDGHGLVIGERIPARRGEHVLEAIGSFAEPLGLPRTFTPQWNLVIPEADRDWAVAQLPHDAPLLLISPASSHPLRNWRAERYAQVADYARRRGWQVVLIGGPSAAERQLADTIQAGLRIPLPDLTGKDNLKRLAALLERAQLLLSPDSGPMHIANAVGTRVLGLHAASNPDRSGPYSDRRWCVNRYDLAARRYLHKSAAELPWGSKIERPGVMDLIETDAVIERLDAAALALEV